jgi:hypothetical protein
MPRSVLAIELREAVRGCSKGLAPWGPGSDDPAWYLCVIEFQYFCV